MGQWETKPLLLTQTETQVILGKTHPLPLKLLSSILISSKGWIYQNNIQPWRHPECFGAGLGFADSKHLGPTNGAHPLCCGPTILHGYVPGASHFLLGSAFHTIRLHLLPPF